ncbi:MAG: threonine synthase [Acidobacteriota bacterium]
MSPESQALQAAHRFVSTRGGANEVDLPEAFGRSLAPDGGLWMPDPLPRLPQAWIDDLAEHDLAAVGAKFAATLLPALPDEELAALAADALNFPIPLVELPQVEISQPGDGHGKEPPVYILELFHGPTLAFKDVGARFMARLLPRLFPAPESGQRLTILAATSGDTGGAVAQAFFGVPDTQVAILYPQGQITPIQEHQIATLGGNVRAFAVEGTFDDCQRLAKAAFADEDLRQRHRLTSANSIHLGRLLPQSLYYAWAVAQLRRRGEHRPPLFVVPSGNFGNLTAGFIAARLGIPAAGFLAATNANDTVPEYLDTALWRPRPSVATLSSAMDVGDPSNFERILHLYRGDHEDLLQDLSASRHGDAETRQAIREVYQATGYILDPHTAVGWLGLRQQRRERPDAPGSKAPAVLLSTAHPIKFREDVQPLVDDALDLPEAIHQLLQRPLQSEPLPDSLEALERGLA